MLKDEEGAQDEYNKLLKVTTSKSDRKILRNIKKDEERHYQQLKKILDKCEIGEKKYEY